MTKEMNEKMKYLLYMDDLKLYGKNDDQIDSLVRTVHLVSKDMGMEFGIKKCGLLSLKRGKVTDREGIILPDGDTMKTQVLGDFRNGHVNGKGDEGENNKGI